MCSKIFFSNAAVIIGLFITKLEQNEDLANLRADTAMDKAVMSAEVKLTSDAMKARDVNRLKGPRN